MRIAAMADLHYTPRCAGRLRPCFETAAAEADVLLLCGDLTDYGQPEEAAILAQDLSDLPIPVIAVTGNHDHETGRVHDVTAILHEQANVVLLDGHARKIDGVWFVGTKGFGGGFGRRTIAAWGEAAIKTFVAAAIEEARKLDDALARARSGPTVALLHYSPIAATLEGEAPEIFPFLGTSHLEDVIDRHPVSLVCHGHAHSGSPLGRTAKGTPVYNVAVPLLRRQQPELLPIRFLTLGESEGEGPAQ